MSDFSVNTATLNNVANDLNGISQQIQSVANEAKSILSKTRNSISVKLAQTNKTNAVYSSVSNCSADAKNLSSALRQVADIYNKYEEAVKNKESVALAKAKAGTKASDKNEFSIKELFLDLLENAGLFGTAVSVVRKGVTAASGFKPSDIVEFVDDASGAIKTYAKTYKNIKLFKNFKYPKGTITSIWRKKFFGLDDFFKSNKINVSKASNISTRWYNNYQKIKSFELDDMKSTGFIISTAISGAVNAFSNYEEYKNGEISGGRAVVETISETAIDVGMDALIGIGTATALATVFGGAPVLAVAGCTWAVSKGLDWATEKLSGGKYDNFTEMASDTVIDLGKKAIDGAVNCYNKAKEGVAAGWRKLKSLF